MASSAIQLFPAAWCCWRGWCCCPCCWIRCCRCYPCHPCRSCQWRIFWRTRSLWSRVCVQLLAEFLICFRYAQELTGFLRFCLGFNLFQPSSPQSLKDSLQTGFRSISSLDYIQNTFSCSNHYPPLLALSSWLRAGSFLVFSNLGVRLLARRTVVMRLG